MKLNVCNPVEKTIRVVVGIGLLSLIVLVEGPLRWFGLLGLVLIGTVLAGWCPLSALFGMSSCPGEKTQKTGT